MSKLKLKDWRIDAILRNGLPIWTQETEDGWFAKVENVPGKMLMISGPWRSQSAAERELLNCIDVIGIPAE